jgi:hypothetical protein
MSHPRTRRCLHAEPPYRHTDKENTVTPRVPKAELPAELRENMVK